MLFLMRVLGCLEGGLGVFRATVCLLHAPVPTMDVSGNVPAPTSSRLILTMPDTSFPDPDTRR